MEQMQAYLAGSETRVTPYSALLCARHKRSGAEIDNAFAVLSAEDA